MRYPDWPERLQRTLALWAETPFAWGQSDCVCFANAVLTAQTGRDELAPWRGRYDSETTARRLLMQHRCRDLGAAVTRALGRAIPAALARRGDLVLVRGGLGVCLGARAMVRKTSGGLLDVPIQDALQAWRVG